MAINGRESTVLRLGIAGLGTASPNVLPEMAAHAHYRITAAADLRQEALDRFAGEYGGETYSSVEAMCASANVDAVYILTPNRFHAEHAITAAEHGKQVFADKPMALSLEDCDRMIDAADRNGVRLLIGHSQGFDAPIRAMAKLAASGELGRPLMINTWFYSDWLYRPRSKDELDPTAGEGLVRRQGPVQVEIVRMIGGGMVRSVRGMTTVAEPARPVEGSYAAYLEFADRTSATMIYDAYGYFDSTELTFGFGLSGNPQDPETNLKTRQRSRSFAGPEDEFAFKDSTRYGGSRTVPGVAAGAGPGQRHAFFGITVVSCEKGDIRQSPTGLIVYDQNGRREVPVSAGDNYGHRYTTAEANLMYDAWVNDRPLAAHDGRWGKATMEVILGVLESAERRSEIMMRHQVPYPNVW